MTASEPGFQPLKPKSRRALLAGALGGVGAWALATIGRADPVRAEGQAVVVGGDYLDATSVTTLTNSTTDADVFLARSLGGGHGVYGRSASGTGVTGESATGRGLHGTGAIGVDAQSATGFGVDGVTDTGVGVRGQAASSGTGVIGVSGSGAGVHTSSTTGTALEAVSSSAIAIHARSGATDGPAAIGWSSGAHTGLFGFSGGNVTPLPSARAKTGVYGNSVIDSASRGVWGEATAGQGVRGEATTGAGLYATATSGYAIRGSGRLRFEKVSGVAGIAAGSTSKTVSPGVNVVGASFVLLTPKVRLGGRDLWFTTNATANTFTIHMSSSRSSTTNVAWLLLG
jgi:hypothetical protein